MLTIDRYLMRLFCRVFVMTFVSLLGVYVVADFVGNLSEFIDYGRESNGLTRTLAWYYGARVPWFFELTGRVTALLAAVFAVTWLERHNELTALMAAGVSRWRVVKPLFIAAFVITILGALNREFGVPRFRLELCRNAQDMVRQRTDKMTPRYDVQTDVFFDGQGIDQRRRRIEQPRLRLPVVWDGWGRTLRAESGTYTKATDEHPSGYLLDNVEAAENLAEVEPLSIHGQPVVWIPRDHAWLGPRQCFVVSRMNPEQLHRGRQWQQYSSTSELVAGLRGGTLDFAPDVRVSVHARIVQPALDMTLLFLGLPFALTCQRRQMMWGVAKSILVVTCFSIVVLISHGLGIHCVLSPALAAWAPLMILIPFALLVSQPLRR